MSSCMHMHMLAGLVPVCFNWGEPERAAHLLYGSGCYVCRLVARIYVGLDSAFMPGTTQHVSLLCKYVMLSIK